MGIISTIRGFLRNMNLVSTKSIEEAFQIKTAASSLMQRHQELARQIYNGNAPWNDAKTPSLRTAYTLMSEVAKRSMLGLAWEFDKSPMGEFLTTQFDPFLNDTKNSKHNLRKSIQHGGAIGELLYMPVVRMDKALIKTYSTNYFVPVGFDELGRLVDVVTQNTVSSGDYKYTLLTRQAFKADTASSSGYAMEVSLKAYSTKANETGNTLGTPINYRTVPEWEDLQEGVFRNVVTRPWFTLYRNPFDNPIEENSNAGFSLYGNAFELFKKLDFIERITDHEFYAGMMRIMATIDLFQLNANGTPILAPGDEEIYKIFETFKGEENFPIKIHNPEFREQSLRARKNDLKREIEAACGIAFGTISDASVQAKTATEIHFSDEKTSSSVEDIQSANESVLHEVAEIIAEMGVAYGLVSAGEFELTISWGDGVTIDDTQFVAWVAMLQATGVIDTNEQWESVASTVYQGRKDVLDKVLEMRAKREEEMKRIAEEQARVQAAEDALPVEEQMTDEI